MGGHNGHRVNSPACLDGGGHAGGARVALEFGVKGAVFLVLNARFLVFNTQLLVFNTKFIILTHRHQQPSGRGDRLVPPQFMTFQYNIGTRETPYFLEIVLKTRELWEKYQQSFR